MMVATRRRVSLLGAAVLGVLGASSLALVACGEDGVTPDCPPLTLYNVRVVYGPLPEAGADASAEEIEEIEAQREAILEKRRLVDEERAIAVDAGCLTDLGDAQATN
jgi:hypothetical protein